MQIRFQKYSVPLPQVMLNDEVCVLHDTHAFECMHAVHSRGSNATVAVSILGSCEYALIVFSFCALVDCNSLRV
jgi:hypothetical protein